MAGHISQTPLSPHPLPMLIPQQQSFLVNLMDNLFRHWPLRPIVVKQLPRRASTLTFPSDQGSSKRRFKTDRLTDTALAILTWDESFIANAIIAVVSIDTLAVLTDTFLLTLIRFFAFVGLFISFLTGWTFAAEGTYRVDALSTFAQCRNRLALVDIFIFT